MDSTLPTQPDDPNSFVRPNAPTPEQMPGVVAGAATATPVYQNPQPEEPEKHYSIGDYAAALGKENDFYVLGKVAYDQFYGQSIDHTADPDFNPIKEAEGTWAQNMVDKLAGLRNRAEFDDFMRRGAEHIENDKVLASGGNAMLAARFLNGMISPAIAMPVFMGPKMLGTAGRLALGGFAGGAVLEPFYRAENPLRTNTDTAIALGAQTLGAVALGKLLKWTPPEEFKKVTDRIQETRGEIPHQQRVEGRQAIVEADGRAGSENLSDNYYGPDAAAVRPDYRDYTPEEIQAAIDEQPQAPNLLVENMYEAGKNGDLTPEQIKAQSDYEAAHAEWSQKHEQNLHQIHEAKYGDQGPFKGEVTFNEEAPAREALPLDRPVSGQSVSAATADGRDYRQMEITPPILQPIRDALGGVVEGIARLPGGGIAADLVTKVGRLGNAIGVSPVGDILERSHSRTFRGLITDLAETTRHLVDERLGNTKASGGGALETAKKVESDRFTWEALTGFEDAYARYAFGSVENAPARLRGSGWWGMTQPAEKISYEEFSERVFMALNYGDRDVIGAEMNAVIPEVAEAAGVFRPLFDHWKSRGQAAKFSNGESMLGDNMGPPLGAESFAPHVPDQNKIANDWHGFVEMFYNSLKADQVTKARQQSQIKAVYSEFNNFEKTRAKIETKIAAIDERLKELDTRLDERAMETRAGKKATDRAQNRVQTAEELMQGVQDDIDFLRGALKDPDSNLGLKALEEEMRMLREEAKPISASELDKLEKAEVARQFYDPDLKRIVEMAIGKRKTPEPPSFSGWIMSNGGVVDVGGNIRSAVENAVPPGFFRKERGMFGNDRARTPDDWGEYFHEMAPEIFPERPTESEVIDILSEGAKGNPPDWWKEKMVDPEDGRVAEAYREFFESRGAMPRNIREAARALSGDYDEKLLKRLLDKVEAGRDLSGIKEDISGRKAGRDAAREQITQLIRDRKMANEKVSGAKVAAGEVKTAGARNRGRVAMLGKRQENLEQVKALLELTQQSYEEQASKNWDDLERHLEGWEGDTTKEFKSLLNKRREMERAAGIKAAMGRGAERVARYTVADDAADRAIRAIIESDRTLSNDELKDMAEQIAGNYRNLPAGRLPYDGDGISQHVFHNVTDMGTRGVFKNRTVPIPAREMSKYLVTDIREMISAYTRTVIPDVQLVEKFGTLDFEDFFKAGRAEYADAKDALKIELDAGRLDKKTFDRRMANLDHQQEKDEANLLGVVERLRGVYGYQPDLMSSKVAAFGRDLNNINTVTSLGRAMVNSLNDAGGNAALRLGFGYVLRDQWQPLIRSLAGLDFANASGEVLRQARELSIGMETMGTLMSHQLDALSNVRPGNRFSKTLAYGASRFQVANGLALWSDMVKAAAVLPASRSFADTALRFRAGKQTEQDIIKMADASIPDWAINRIADQWEKHATDFKGAMFPNVDKWTDKQAVDIFRMAMRRETDALVVTAGVGTAPLWTASLFGRVIGQFKAYMFAAHEKMYLANAQNFQFRMAGAMTVNIGLGALSYYAYMASKGEKPSDNPMVVLKEAADRSGFMALYNEANKITSKATGGNLDAWRPLGAKQPLSRRSDNSVFGDLLGPSANLMEKGLKVAGHVGAAMAPPEGKSARDYFTGQDVHDLRTGFFPGQNLLFPGSMIYDAMEDGLVRLGHLTPTKNQKKKMQQ